MTLDPRTQLALMMGSGLTRQQDQGKVKRQFAAPDRDRLRKEQERRSMEALTQALLDPCTTVQEAVLDSLLQRTGVDSW